MAMIQLPRNKTSIEAMGEAVNNLMGTIIQLKMMQGQRMINEAAQGVIAQGGGMNEIVNAVSQVKQKQQSSGLFNKIFDTFNPNKPIFTGTSDTENMINQYGIRNAVLPQGQNYTAAPWYNSPQWKDTPEGQAAAQQAAAKTQPQALNMVDINRAGKMMTSAIDTAKKKRIGSNYSKDDLLSAWGDFKTNINYDSMPATQQSQLVNLWQTKLKNRAASERKLFGGSEVDWDPNEISEGSSQDIGNSGQAGGTITVKAPDGTVGTIPANEWEEAQKQGYVRIQ